MQFALVPTAPSDLPASQRGHGELHTRYEDIAEDGRMGLRPLTHALGAALWRNVLGRHALVRALGHDAVVPILSRLVIECGGGPISVRGAVACEGAFAVSRAVDQRGEPRFRIDMWASIAGERGRTWGPAIPGAGERIPIGALYAEHVLTRPFGPPERRKVASLGEAGAGVAVREAAWHEPDALLALPEGARFLDDGFVLDEGRTVFGLGHTDSNQHVNSLVYPLLVEEAALRRLDSAGLPTRRFASFVELRFRKPAFAGDRVRVVSRLYARGERHGVLAAVVDASEARAAEPRTARTYACLELEA